MNQNGHPVNVGESEPGVAREYERGRQSTPRRPRSTAREAIPEPQLRENSGITIDAWSLLRPASRRWYWMVFGAIIGAVGGALLALSIWHVGYTATAQIVRYDPPVPGEAYRPQQLNGPTLMDMIASGELRKNVARKLKRPTSAWDVDSRVAVIPARNSEVVTIKSAGANAADAIELANAFSAEVIAFTQRHQRTEALEADRLVAEQLKETEEQLTQAKKDMPAVAPPGFTPGADPSATGSAAVLTPMPGDQVFNQIQTAKAELAKLLVKYMDAHPAVKAKRAEIAALEAMVPPVAAKEQAKAIAEGKKLSPATTTVSATAFELAFYNLRTLENLRTMLQQRHAAIQSFLNDPPGNFRPLQTASPESVAVSKPSVRVALVAAFFAMIGCVLTGAELLRRELFDTRLKTESDVKRVTGLPVIASLGDLRTMSVSAREAWAFRTWIALQDRLAYSPNHGLICGLTSSNAGDGRTTWVNLLAGAARKCGFRVLTIATRPTGEAAAEPVETAEAAATATSTSSADVVAEKMNGNGRHAGTATATSTATETAPAVSGRSAALMSNPNDFAETSRAFSGDSDYTALTASALFTPAMVTEKLMGSEVDPLVHIPLPGWTWNLERRKQWQSALNVWRKIDNVVILVELPPASMAESVLLASNLPNLLWLVEAGKSNAGDTRPQLETLRHARCNLVGAVINRAMPAVAHGRFARWVGCLLPFALALFVGGQHLAAAEARVVQTDTAALQPAASFSVSSPAQRAAWQQKLTLGPGDVLTIGLYGDPEALREEIPVGPDGRISYMQAVNVMASGLTVDEFREKLNEELGKYLRSPQVYVVPVAYKSKKYFVLGRVTQRGAFTLDRPTTLIEAVARARGVETGLSADRSLVELADLSHSFVIRNGKKLPVDFEKLFQEGDLSQNVPLEPNDYIYFPAADQKEVYVLGAVKFPGAYNYTSAAGAIGAIAGRGGFTDRAWKNRILVVRGSLGHPETFVLDAAQVLSARTADVKLQPKDIVYVSERPWIRAEDLLDEAASAFVTSAIVTWTGLHVDPISNPTR